MQRGDQAVTLRCSKAILNAPDNYPYYELGNGVRTPIEILVHMSDVIRYAQSVFDFQIQPKNEIGNWNDEGINGAIRMILGIGLILISCYRHPYIADFFNKWF